MAYKRLPKCKATGKSKIKTEKQAERIMFRIWSHDPNSDIYDMHPYVCEHCGFWHIGHLSKYLKKVKKL